MWRLNKMPRLSEIAQRVVNKWGFTFTYYRGHNGEICEIWDPKLNRYCGGGYLTVDWYYSWGSDLELFYRFTVDLLAPWLADAILERYELTHKETTNEQD